MVIVYYFDPQSGEYLDRAEAMVCQRTGAVLVPEHATLEVLPEKPARKGCVYAFREGAWVQVVDHRGKVFYEADGQRVEISEIGVGIKRSWSLEPPPPSEDALWRSVRLERDALLDASDWTQIADNRLGDDERVAWSAYRQALRDLPSQFERAGDVAFPVCEALA